MTLDFSRCFVIVILLSAVPLSANAQLFGGQIKTNNRGIISALNCTSATNSGTLTAGTAASGVSSSVPYTGGNGGAYSGQTVSSTGVTGLTATLAAGTFANGAGSLTYTIIGTPNAVGTASFALNIGGQSCTLVLIVQSLLAAQYPVGSIFCASGPTAIVDVVNPSTGKTWMDRNLGASQVATSRVDSSSYGDLYQWGRFSDGHQCRSSSTTNILSTSDQPGHGDFIISTSGSGTNGTPPYSDWRSPPNSNLWQGVNGINNPCPFGYRLPTSIELNNERLSWSSNNTSGAFSSPLKFPLAGYRNNNNTFIDIGSGSGSSGGLRLWSSTKNTQFIYYSDYLGAVNTGAGIYGSTPNSFGFSVRCIKN